MNDTQILDWIEENLERLHENAHGKADVMVQLGKIKHGGVLWIFLN